MCGWPFPERVNVGHGQVVMHQGHQGFDGAPLGLTPKLAGFGQASLFPGTSEVCRATSNCGIGAFAFVTCFVLWL